jgi:hypothetical protein
LSLPFYAKEGRQTLLTIITEVIAIITFGVIIATCVLLRQRLKIVVASWETTRLSIDKTLTELQPSITNLKEVTETASEAADRLRKAIEAFDKLSAAFKGGNTVADVIGGMIKGGFK